MDVILELISQNHDHIVNLAISCTLGLLGAFVNALSKKDFRNGFQVGRIILSVSFVSPTIYILLAGFVDVKLQMGFTVLSGAFHDEALFLLRRRFDNMKGTIEMGGTGVKRTDADQSSVQTTLTTDDSNRGKDK
jgi:hypothetical protein